MDPNRVRSEHIVAYCKMLKRVGLIFITSGKLSELINRFIPSGLVCLNSLDRSISNRKGVWLFLLLCFVEIPVRNANTVDPDQTPRSVASDLGLNCLPTSLLRAARHKWIKDYVICSLLCYKLYFSGDRRIWLNMTEWHGDCLSRVSN